MACDQRARGICIGEYLLDDYPWIPWLFDRGTSRSGRPHDHAYNLEVALERADGSVVDVRQSGRFVDFTLDLGLPSWRYEIDGVVIEMSTVLPSGQNLLHASFRVRDHSQRVRLRLSPLIDFRALEAPVGQLSAREYVLESMQSCGVHYDVNATASSSFAGRKPG
jgi:hypothetical protein